MVKLIVANCPDISSHVSCDRNIEDPRFCNSNVGSEAKSGEK